MAEQSVNETLAAVEEATNGTQDGRDQNKLSLDSLALLINTQRVRQIEEKVKGEYKELKERQQQVRFLHKLLRVVNAETDSKGGLDLSKDSDLKELLKEAREMGVEIPDQKKYTKEEKDRLVDNIRTACEDLNLQNEMQIQTITRLTHERYEAFQLARSILKPLHDDKLNKARAIAGR